MFKNYSVKPIIANAILKKLLGHTYRSKCHIYVIDFCFDNQAEGGWILEGQKRWIGNSKFADLLVILARNTTTKQINAYVKCHYI